MNAAEFAKDIAAVKALAAHNEAKGRPAAPGRCETTMAITSKYGARTKPGMAIMRAYIDAWTRSRLAA